MIVANIRQELKDLAESIATNPAFSSQVTSASVNGQSFSKTHAMTNQQRLHMLHQVVRMVDNLDTVSSRVRPIF